jgi:ABC-type branched-subunit amino acid transport system substrate-binding protein
LQSAQQLFDTHRVVAFVGPAEPEIAQEMVPLVADHGLVQILASVTDPKLQAPDSEGGASVSRWFRLAPTPDVVGCTLGLRLLQDNMSRIVILQAPDVYNTLLKRAFVSSVATATDVTVQTVVLDGTTDFVTAVTQFDPSAVVLFAYPSTAASVIPDLVLAQGPNIRWYFPPTLNDDAFLLNIEPSLVEGAIGISPWIDPDKLAAFTTAFQQRWDLDTPAQASLFYYDAVALLALAIASAPPSDGSAPAALPSLIVSASLSGGPIVSWNELDTGMQLARSGQPINYYGVSSSVDLGADGELAFIPELEYWQIVQGGIVPTGDRASCLE